MNRVAAILDPECTECGQPMVWQAVLLVNKIPVNVFKCPACEKMKTVRAPRRLEPVS